VDKALQGETDGLWGRAYFDLRNITDPAYKTGDEWIRNASEVCRHLGFETVVDEKPETFSAGFPMSQIAIYIGWYDVNASGPFAQPTVEFMPGAFAYHLHSYSARPFRSTTQAWVGPLLAKGAAATMGCVEEPYLTGTPDMTIFTARFVYSGMSFGEAAYACQTALSWQTTVVGDPLYRPFGKNPDALKDELLRRNSKLLEWYYLRLLNVNLVAGKPIAEGVAVLEQFENTKNSAVLTEKLGDLYAAQGKPASAAHAYQDALKLEPTPQQRVRLQLALADKLTTADEPAQAYETYLALLHDDPDYADKLQIYKYLLPLAEKLGKKDDAEKYRAAINPEPHDTAKK
jgi:tetratricopeptide (TPR) repeat protein